MNKSSTLRNSLMLTPLIGATDSLVTALGVWLMFVLVLSAYGLGMGALRSRLIPATQLLACLLVAATLTSCAELAMQAWSLQWHQHLGFYTGLIALQCVVLEHNGFFQSTGRDRLRLCGLFGALMIGLGLLREFIGNGTLGSHLSWLAGAQPDWQGWVLTADGGLRLATLAPGGFILLGLLIAARQAWTRPTSTLTSFEETHRP
ncbi:MULTISPECIES: Rnf-Nqr domain containing protein [Pseudomonas]|uniref:NADH:quinone oxidoreductase n=1 Tax=Pseudomonas frederiksbergensis TaxID=104087 RepID=A0A2S8HFU8_9PSED|nr:MULTISPECIES: Rnf-Nqr domain containing protein [Pseudomonas]PQP01388.1 NADH:quinone oxidoreductase [Pseudomonas frederiksbergensis]WLG49780.1 Rnf-Nqr domain containing protein [Pseudomonas sp. FP1742]